MSGSAGRSRVNDKNGKWRLEDEEEKESISLSTPHSCFQGSNAAMPPGEEKTRKNSCRELAKNSHNRRLADQKREVADLGKTHQRKKDRSRSEERMPEKKDKVSCPTRCLEGHFVPIFFKQKAESGKRVRVVRKTRRRKRKRGRFDEKTGNFLR